MVVKSYKFILGFAVPLCLWAAPVWAQGGNVSPAASSVFAVSGAQASVASGHEGEQGFDASAVNGGVPSDLMSRVGIDQKMDSRVPLSLKFKDENGKSVVLGEYFGKRPVLLNMMNLISQRSMLWASR